MLRKIYAKLFPTNAVMSTVYYLRNEKPRLNIMTPKESIDYIEKTGCSVARLGEGEFELILDSRHQSQKGVAGFQQRDPALVVGRAHV